MKDLRSRYGIDTKKVRVGNGTEGVVSFSIAKEHYDKFTKLVSTRYNRDITIKDTDDNSEPELGMPF